MQLWGLIATSPMFFFFSFNLSWAWANIVSTWLPNAISWLEIRLQCIWEIQMKTYYRTMNIKKTQPCFSIFSLGDNQNRSLKKAWVPAPQDTSQWLHRSCNSHTNRLLLQPSHFHTWEAYSHPSCLQTCKYLHLLVQQCCWSWRMRGFITRQVDPWVTSSMGLPKLPKSTHSRLDCLDQLRTFLVHTTSRPPTFPRKHQEIIKEVQGALPPVP